MKILNLYAGIGGNRLNWGHEHEVTAIENNEEIASLYKKYFPNDIVIVADAHQYLLEHIKDFDFIWSSPPCPTHSKLKFIRIHQNIKEIVYPNMSLYQEILLLKHFSKKSASWVVENVTPYYDLLIKPQIILGRHCFWTNFYVRNKKFQDNEIAIELVTNQERFGFNLKNEKIKNKKVILRNLVNPEISKYLLDEANKKKKPIFNFNY